MDYKSIATKRGDKGETDSFGKGRISKDHISIKLVGELDLLQSSLGVAVAYLQEFKYEKIQDELGDVLVKVQYALYRLSGDIGSLHSRNDDAEKIFFDCSELEYIENLLKDFEGRLPELQNFVYPLGDLLACHLHQSRAICRRSEVLLVEFLRDYYLDESAIGFVNRLSDLLFIFARFVNAKMGYKENVWKLDK